MLLAGQISDEQASSIAFPVALDVAVDFHKDSGISVVSAQGSTLLSCTLARASLYASAISRDLNSGIRAAASLRAGLEMADSAVWLNSTASTLEPWSLVSLGRLDLGLQANPDGGSLVLKGEHLSSS